MPLVGAGRGQSSVPIPAVLGALLSFAGWVAVLVFPALGARYVGIGWMLAGGLYAVRDLSQDRSQKPLLRRVTIPERALRHETLEPEFGSILVPIFGERLDDDIIQTAGRLAGDVRDGPSQGGSVIEVIWVAEIPLSLPLDAPLPEAQVQRAKDALARAKAVGEEYDGVHVIPTLVRARRTGPAIVTEARERGVEAIVLAAEEPSRIRGGALLGGAGGPLENYVGEVTKYVLRKAPCRVILTAPPADATPANGAPDQPRATAPGDPPERGQEHGLESRR